MNSTRDSTARPSRPEPADPVPHALHDRALENLRFIRDTMERSASFTALSGWGLLGAGVTALGAAAFVSAGLAPSWLGAWIGEAAIGLAVSFGCTLAKARRAGSSITRGAGRKFVLGFAPPALAAVALTPALLAAGAEASLAGMWLLLYGAAITTAGAFSVRAVPAMGVAFMATGALALAYPEARDVWLALGFGGLHIIFGWIIARKHGG